MHLSVPDDPPEKKKTPEIAINLKHIIQGQIHIKYQKAKGLPSWL